MVRRQAFEPVLTGRLGRLLTLALQVRLRTWTGPPAVAFGGGGAGGDVSTRLFAATAGAPAAVASPVPSPAPRLPRDPERPRQPANAYLLYRRETGGTGKQWKAMDDSEQRPYREQADLRRAEYFDKVAEYKASGREAWWKAKRELELEPSRKHRDPQRPKRPLTSFMLFAQDIRDPEMGLTENSKAAGEQWRAMSDAQRAYYDAWADELRMEYSEAMEAYQASGREAEWLAGLIAERAVDPERPKAPLSAFLLYFKERARAADGLTTKEVGKVVGEGWKDMSDEEKRPYKEQAASEQEKYEEELDLYKVSGKEAAWEAKAKEWSRAFIEGADEKLAP